MTVVVIIFGIVGVAFRYVLSAPTATSEFGGPAPPARVSAILADVFSSDACHRPSDAVTQVRARLDAAGLRDWSVSLSIALGADDCVSSTIESDARRVVLLPALRPEVKTALAAIAARLIEECHTKDEAAELVRAALEAAGSTGWELRTDGGVMGPIDRIEEVRAHFQAGCWIYSGTGYTDDGTRLYWIGGVP